MIQRNRVYRGGYGRFKQEGRVYLLWTDSKRSNAHLLSLFCQSFRLLTHFYPNKNLACFRYTTLYANCPKGKKTVCHYPARQPVCGAYDYFGNPGRTNTLYAMLLPLYYVVCPASRRGTSALRWHCEVEICSIFHRAFFNLFILLVTILGTID